MNENEFGYRIRQALNEGLDSLDYRTTYRLQQARQAALARHHADGQTERLWAPAYQTAGGPPVEDEPVNWLRRLGLAAPLLALIIGIVGIYDYQESRRISELADMDFAVLLDDVPLETYADKGFGALLKAPNEDL
ncbi:MAG: uncharacterized protein H6R12_1908 [Proteobacteria bacterium]|jgi:hypothetical protein|nr:uncharacterized protein [Pseudomonadota bacterium]